MSTALTLKSLLARPNIVVAPGAPDCLTARLIQQLGFDAVYMTGLGVTAKHLGTPDLGLLTQTEMASHARNMVRSVDSETTGATEPLGQRGVQIERG